MDEIFRLLRPGGWFCFGEPHTGSIPDLFRRLWYRLDGLFETGEAAIDLRKLEAANADRFDVEMRRHVGSVAYLLVFSSMIFRIPRRLKPWYAPPLFMLERAMSPLHGRRTACFALARWRKRRVPGG